jgi:hypothetical protein
MLFRMVLNEKFVYLQPLGRRTEERRASLRAFKQGLNVTIMGNEKVEISANSKICSNLAVLDQNKQVCLFLLFSNSKIGIGF